MTNKHGYQSTKTTKAAALLQVLALGGIEVSLFIAALFVTTLDTQFGMGSQLVISLAVISILAGIFTFKRERIMARLGLVMMALSIGGLLLMSYVGSQMTSGREIMSLVGLVLIGTMVAGYFMLLYGSLKTAGWAFGGAAVFAGMSLVFWALIMFLGNRLDLRDDQMASQMVTGSILFVATVVGLVAFLVEGKKRKS